MFTSTNPQPVKTNTTKAIRPQSQRVRKVAEYQAEPVTWQEEQHYEVEFEKWLEKNVSKDAKKAFRYTLLLGMFKQHGIGPNGHKEVRRARNFLKKFLPKFNPKDWE